MDNLLNLIFIFLATVALGLMFGLTILKTIDSRLSEVSINLPEIKIPEAHVNVNFPDSNKEFNHTRPSSDPPSMTGGKQASLPNAVIDCDEDSESLCERIKPTIMISTSSKITENNQLKEFNTQLQNNLINSIQSAQPIYQNPTINSPFLQTNPTINSEINRQHLQTNSTINNEINNQCLQTNSTPSQYYKHPDMLTPKQKIKYMLTAKFSKMTPIDYRNWLLCFQDRSHNLTPYHQKMLDQVRRGGIPSPPLS